MAKFLWTVFLFSISFPCAWAQDAYTDSLLNLLEKANPDTHKVDLLRNIGVQYANQDPRKAIEYWKQGVALSYQLNYIKGLARNYINIGTGYSYLSKMDSTIIYADSGIKYSKIIGDKDRLALVYLNKADGYRMLSIFKEALLYCDTASMYATQTGNTDRLARIYDITSGIYSEQRQFYAALAIQKKALELYKKDSNQLMQGQVYDDFGLIYQQIGKLDSALYFHKLAISIGEKFKDHKNLATYYWGLANTYNEQGLHAKAETEALKALQLGTAQENNNQLGAIFALLCQINLKQNKNAEAVRLGIIAYNYAVAEVQIGMQQQVAELLAQAYQGIRDHENAYKFLHISANLKDSIVQAKYNSQVANLQTSFESKEKDKEILLLEKDKEIQNQKLIRQRLSFAVAAALFAFALLVLWQLINKNKLKHRKEELELRNRIAADLHDDVGSSLSSIQMLSHMASNQGIGAKQTEILNRMSNYAKETMDKMGDIVWMIKTGEHDTDSLKQRMERFAYEICDSKNIALHLHLDELEKLKLTMEQRKNVYLIFKEALNNAIKYSHTSNIEISCTYQLKKMVLEIKDFGQGFNDQLITRGNGLQNMQNRAKELQANLEVKSTPGAGTSIKLRLPV